MLGELTAFLRASSQPWKRKGAVGGWGGNWGMGKVCFIGYMGIVTSVRFAGEVGD